MYNIGNYVILSIIFIEFLLMIFFIAKGYNKFINYIMKNFLNINRKNQNILKLNNSNINKNKNGKKEIKRNKIYKRKTCKNIENIKNIVETQSNRTKTKILKIKENNKSINNNKKKKK